MRTSLVCLTLLLAACGRTALDPPPACPTNPDGPPPAAFICGPVDDFGAYVATCLDGQGQPLTGCLLQVDVNVFDCQAACP